MRPRHALRYAIGVALAISLLTLGMATNAAAQAQASTGQIVGTVYDSTGAQVPKAKVALNSKDTGLKREETSGDEGQYLFVLVPVGHYTITFTHPGFKTYKVEVDVTVGAALTVNANLALGEVSQVVEVTATPVIETTQPNADALIGVRPIEELPINGRRFQDFVTLTPTVQIEPQRNGISFVGQRGINANVNIDGADYNEPFFGGIRGGERSNNAYTIPQEAISQFQVVSYGYSVEFGRSTGGLLTATTKSGTNDLHGSAFFFARNGVLALNDAFGRQAISNLYQEGGSVGGRLHRDKAFFFAAFERQTNDNPRVVVFHALDPLSPTPATTEAFCFLRNATGCPSGSGQEQPFTQSNDAITGFGRLDFQPSQNHRISGSYHYSKNTGTNAVSTGDSISPETNRAQSNNGIEGDRTNTVVGQWTAIFSPRVILETRGQYSLENRPRLSNSTLTGINFGSGGGTFATTGARNFLPTTLDDWRVQGSSNLTWTHGSHAVKFGGEYNFLRANQFFFFNQFGVFSIPGSDPTTILTIASCAPLLSTGTCSSTPTHNRFDSTAVTYSVNIGNGLLAADLKQFATFVQDTWRITSRFTLTAGFRWEAYTNPKPDVSNTALYSKVKNFAFPIGLTVDPAFIPSNYRQYMPRVGFAWDPRGNARWVIRASAGFFYAPTPVLLFAAPLNNFRIPAGDLSVQLPLGNFSACPAGVPPLFTGDRCNTAYSQLRHIGVDLNTSTLNNLPKITPKQISDLATALNLASPDPSLSSSPISMANNYESPRSWQWSVGTEHELTRGWSVGVDFVNVNTVHLERDRNLNLPKPFIAAGDLSLRPCFAVRAGTAPCGTSPTGTPPGSGTKPRPLVGPGDVTIRGTDARSRYTGLTFRSNYRRGRLQFQTYYTLSWNYSNDDNERLASGFDYDNSFNLAPEYGFSRLDARHLFQFNSLYDLPWGFTISGLGRFRSGRPIDSAVGSDANGDNNSFGDRAFQAPGVSFVRNSFRDRRVYNVDMRIAKKFRLPREGMSLSFMADFFNLFNFDNVTIGSRNQNFGLGVSPTTGATLAPNVTFLRLKDASFCNKNSACYDTNNVPGSPFTVQLGVRFQF